MLTRFGIPFPSTGSFCHFSIGEADPGVCIPEVLLLHFSLGKVGSSGSFSGDASGVGSPKWKPKSGVELRLEVPAPTGGVSGVVVPSGIPGVWVLFSLSLLALLCVFMLEGESSSLESGIQTLGW